MNIVVEIPQLLLFYILNDLYIKPQGKFTNQKGSTWANKGYKT